MGVHPRTQADLIADLRQELRAAKKLIKAQKRLFESYSQKWVAAVDEYNECRYDCEPERLAAA